MLSGIKVGKRKKKQQQQNQTSAAGSNNNTAVSSNSNTAAAAALRTALQQGNVPVAAVATTVHNPTRSLDERLAAARARIDDPSVIIVHSNGSKTVKPAGLSKIDDLDDPAAQVRQILRNTKRQRKVADTKGDDDEALEQMQAHLSSSSSRKKAKPNNNTITEQQVQRHDAIARQTAHCWWWLSAPSFDRRRLLALGDHVSLVWVPSKKSLHKCANGHYYLVPLAHTPSLAGAGPAVWREMRQFQASLRQLHNAQNNETRTAKSISLVCFEVTKPDARRFVQTRLEVVVVPADVADDVPLYLRSSFAEHQSELTATHNKWIDNTQGGLPRSVPPQVPYLYVEYGSSTPKSMAHVLDQDLPADFVLDTLASMMDLEPMRFRSSSSRVEEAARRAFLEQWSQYDWTVQLDGTG